MSVSTASTHMPIGMQGQGFHIPLPPVAPFVHGPSPSQQSATVSDDASDDEDAQGGLSDSPFFTEVEMGNNEPVMDPQAERDADPRFPSPHDFDKIVYDYLKGLSLKKREKALLNRTMYQAVLTVLNRPKDTTFKTAQFRFWAKKMFDTTMYSGEQVITHDHKPVAVREQIFEVLIHCHTQADHGGRDKTSAQVRKYYSWIPKEIIAKFVTKCPHCRSKRTMSSASLGPMSNSQHFLAGLQETEQNLSRKQPITLAAARAAAIAATQEKPKPSYGKVALNEAHREAIARHKQAQLNSFGRVHLAGSSRRLPADAVYYPNTHQDQFGNANYFNPMMQHYQYPQAQAMPGPVHRSISYDETAARTVWDQNQAVEMYRRASDPVIYHDAAGIEATPRARALLSQTHRLVHAPAQPIMSPEPHVEESDILQDVREACLAHAESELSRDNMPEQPQSQSQSHVVAPAFGAQHDQIDPALAGQYEQYGQVFNQATYPAYYPSVGPASAGQASIDFGAAAHSEYAFVTNAEGQYYDATAQVSYDQINGSPYVQAPGNIQYNQVEYNAYVDLPRSDIGNGNIAQYVPQHAQTDASGAEDYFSQYVHHDSDYGCDVKSDPAGPQAHAGAELQPTAFDVVDSASQSSTDALGLVF